MKEGLNYKKISSLVFATTALSMNGLLAEEFTLELGKFQQVLKVDVVATPVDTEAIQISPASWSDFTITSVVKHGMPVKKGDVLLGIDTEAIDEKIIDLTQGVMRQQLMLEKAELEFIDFTSTTEEALADAKVAYERFQQDYLHFRQVARAVKITDLEYAVTRAKNSLAYSNEELVQLMKMYEEDGLTEETEEIIIKRVKNALVAAEKKLVEAERKEKYEKEVQLPRQDEDWKAKEGKKKREWELVQKTLPLKFNEQEFALEKLKAILAKAQKEVAELEADRKLMDIVSPVDGVVHYGDFKDGKLDSTVAKKVLRKGGKLPADQGFITVVPKESKVIFNAFFSESEKAMLGEVKVGTLHLKIKPWDSIPVDVNLETEAPLLSSEWIVSCAPKVELTAAVAVGSKAKVSIITASVDEVLSIPRSAVEIHPDGKFTVKLKMADDEPEEREIKIGRESEGQLEILDGLEDGQVIIIDEEKSK